MDDGASATLRTCLAVLPARRVRRIRRGARFCAAARDAPQLYECPSLYGLGPPYPSPREYRYRAVQKSSDDLFSPEGEPADSKPIP